MNLESKFKGFDINVYEDIVGSVGADYTVVFSSGLMQMRGAGGQPQPVPPQPTARVKVRGDEITVRWEHFPDDSTPNISRGEFEEEAKRQVQAKRDS